MGGLSPAEKIKVQEIRDQVEDTTTKYQFTPYKYKGTSAEDMGMQPTLHAMSRVGEYIAHRDTFFNSKFLNRRTATEDWERRNVYGATFPEWQRPYESYILNTKIKVWITVSSDIESRPEDKDFDPDL